MKLTHIIIILLIILILLLLFRKKTEAGPGEQDYLNLGDIGLDIGPADVTETSIARMA